MIPLHSLLRIDRSDKYDLNHANALPLMPTKFYSLFKRMLWSIVSNAALRSRSTNREIQPRSDDKSRSFVTLRAVSVLWDGLNQWSQTQFLEGHSSAQFSSSQLQLTPAWKFLAILKTVISWIRCLIRVGAKLCRAVALQELSLRPVV